MSFIIYLSFYTKFINSPYFYLGSCFWFYNPSDPSSRRSSRRLLPSQPNTLSTTILTQRNIDAHFAHNLSSHKLLTHNLTS